DILLYDGTRMTVGPTTTSELEETIRRGGRKGEIYARLKSLRDCYAGLVRERFPRIPRRVSGYNLDELLPEEGFNVARALVGSEGTCVMVLEATLNLVASPPARSLLVLGYRDVFSAGDHTPEVAGHHPTGLEALDFKFVNDLKLKGLQKEHIKMLPAGKAWLLVEFGGDTKAESDAKARLLMAKLRLKPGAPSMKLFDDKEEEEEIWRVRESGLGATAHIPGEQENWEGWEDAAVPPDQVGDYLRGFKRLLDKYNYVTSLYGHFGQGCIHCRINFDLKTAEGIRKWRAFLSESSDLVLEHGGSLSGEHGDGQSRAELLPKMFGKELIEAFEEYKTIWDPDWKMNPGKVVRPYAITENLRYGSNYRPVEPETHFKYVNDGFSFSHAMERCVGVGECRKTESGTMCPSYMATGEEEHTTRGRARLLFEMLNGSELKREGWRSDAVKESLDLCLSCKGCKGDCPVHVDMATYKAEFLSHYYKRRLRPVHAYVFGLIHKWAHLASSAPKIANFFGQHAMFAGLAKRIIGIAPERKLPPFAEETFKQWWMKRTAPVGLTDKPHVILWPDTFNNHFHPQIARAAVEVLEDAGFKVEVPEANMCCGRPLYDYGMLDIAEKWLRHILDTISDSIQDGTPVVVLEPSCASVFRDEMTNLFPHDQNAKRLKQQTFLLSEFLNKHAPDYPPKQLDQHAIVHGHCHHRAVMHMTDEEAMLKRAAPNYKLLDSGCCGMAGAFGFEKGDHYDVSIKCGERVLLPEVRKTDHKTLIVTNGFSCHEQILQQTGRRALHLAEVLQLVMKEGKPRLVQKPKAREPEPETKHQRRWRWIAAGAVAAAGVAGFVTTRRPRKSRLKSLVSK
ncbi:MAG: FAD-binding and (Fe-S)-binding domain-containing protein, partial [Limisphaerales bacterium]